MTLPASGAIGLGQIAAEFGIAANSVFPTAFYGLGGAPASGALSFSDFYGRSGVTPPAIQTSNASPSVFTFSQSASADITCAVGKTIANITLIGGSVSPRISPGSSGGSSATGTASAPASGSGVADATYRYTTNTGESVDVAYHAEWGT